MSDDVVQCGLGSERTQTLGKCLVEHVEHLSKLVVKVRVSGPTISILSGLMLFVGNNIVARCQVLQDYTHTYTLTLMLNRNCRVKWRLFIIYPTSSGVL